MRSLKQIVRTRLLQLLHVNPTSIDDNVGSELVGDMGHRQYVGGLWEVLGRLQFRFMIEQGLQPQHVFLDIACGSLRGGVRFIPYLDRGNYLGLDIQQRLIDIGIRHELGPQLNEIKKPEFVVSDAFEFGRFSKQPDFALAQSLFTHLTEADIALCLRNLRSKAKSKTKFYATFFESEQPMKNPEHSHSHKNFFYTQKQMTQFGEASGWFTRYIGDWKHPRRQMMLEYSIKA
jgi:ubiquinone/menaquinone biosynthesis C-methylase UbiE